MMMVFFNEREKKTIVHMLIHNWTPGRNLHRGASQRVSALHVHPSGIHLCTTHLTDQTYCKTTNFQF